MIEKILDKLTNDTILIFHHLNLFRKFNEIIKVNQRLNKMDSTILDWMTTAFTNDLVIGIGRICDRDKRTDSLVQFLGELKNAPGYLMRNRHIKLYNSVDNFMLNIANNSFDKLAGKGQDSFSSSFIDLDIIRITEENPCKKIRDFRNQYIAHSEKVKNNPLPTYDELFESFEIIKEIVKKYNLLIRAASMSDLIPTIQGNYEEVFTVPWIEVR